MGIRNKSIMGIIGATGAELTEDPLDEQYCTTTLNLPDHIIYQMI
jgi:hypothetical protein